MLTEFNITDQAELDLASPGTIYFRQFEFAATVYDPLATSAIRPARISAPAVHNANYRN